MKKQSQMIGDAPLTASGLVTMLKLETEAMTLGVQSLPAVDDEDLTKGQHQVVEMVRGRIDGRQRALQEALLRIRTDLIAIVEGV